MRERARDKGRLQDIVDYSANVMMLIDGYDYESLIADKRTYYAVMKNVEIVGEAAYMLTKAFKLKHPEIPQDAGKRLCDSRHFRNHRIKW